MTSQTSTFERSRRVDWLLFRMHYLRTLGPLALVCFGTFAVLFIVTRFVGAMRPAEKGQIGPLLDGIAALLATIVALPAGASVFSRSFKEQHVLFFHTLPVPRLRQWFLFASASATALLTIYAGFFLIRPGWLRGITQASNALVPAAIALLSFTVGLCFSLVFARTVLTYVSAYLAAIFLPLFVLLLILAPALAFELTTLSGDPAGRLLDRAINTVPGVAGLLIVAALSLTFAILSAIFYVRGESSLLRIQIRNAVLAGVVSLAVAFGIARVGMSLLTSATPVASDYAVAPDGTAIAVREIRTSWLSDVRVLDVVSGAMTSPRRHEGLVAFDWTGNGQQLQMVIREVSLLRRLAGHVTDRFETWSRDGRLLSTHALPGSLIAGDSDRDRSIAALIDRELVRVVTVEHGSGTHELLRIPKPTQVWIRGGIVFALADKLPPRAWRITGDAAHDIGRAIGSGRDEPLVFGDKLYRNPESVLADIERLWPVPRSAGEGVRYGIRSGGTMRTIYALVRTGSQVDLHAGNIATQTWKLVAADVITTAGDVSGGKVIFDAPVGASVVLTRANEVVTYARRSPAGTTHMLYDARTGTPLSLYEQPAGDSRSLQTRVRSVPGVTGLLAAVYQGDRPVAEVIVDGTMTRPLQTLAPEPLLALLRDGGQLRRQGDRGLSVWKPDGTTRTLMAK